MSSTQDIFRLLNKNAPVFGPRLGKVELTRSSSPTKSIQIETPGIITCTSRGVVPHLTRDHVDRSRAIDWVHVPFESFLERDPPIPTIQPGPHRLHTFLGFDRDRHVLSLSLRDPQDVRELPPNGKEYINANTIRGVRKMNPTSWRAHVVTCNADFVVALSDTPYTPPPFSQKRITKSIERSISWLAQLLQPFNITPLPPPPPPSQTSTSTSSIVDEGQGQNGASESESERQRQRQSHPLNVLVHMAGDTSAPARRAFSASLTEPLYGKEAEQVNPLRTLDEGVCGYVFDLLPLRTSILADITTTTSSPSSSPTAPQPQPKPLDLTSQITSLMQTSLHSLPPTKLRIVHTAASPHEILALIRDVGVDMFDVQWAQTAADCGVALDFAFPVPVPVSASFTGLADDGEIGESDERKRKREDGKRDLGHNLYDGVYARDFSRFAECLMDGASANIPASSSSPPSSSAAATAICPCIACSPLPAAEPLRHSSLDISSSSSLEVIEEEVLVDREGRRCEPPFTRAYVHHLLHTHEMSAHTLLAAHNIAVLDAFFDGVRRVLSESSYIPTTSTFTSNSDSNSNKEPNEEAKEGTANDFAKEVERFNATYDESQSVFSEARKAWAEVEYARGKGRLAREKAKKVEEAGLGLEGDGGVVDGA